MTPIQPLQRCAAEFTGMALLMLTLVALPILWHPPSAPETGIVSRVAEALSFGIAYAIVGALIRPLSGAQLNPLVSLLGYLRGQLSAPLLLALVIAQLCGTELGLLVGHGLFKLPLLETATHLRASAHDRVGEVLATTAVLVTISLIEPRYPRWTPPLIAALLSLCYALSAGLNLANPALTLGRTQTATLNNIASASLPALLLAQISGLALCLGILLLLPPRQTVATANRD